MTGKVNGNDVILFAQAAVLMRPDAMIAAGTVDENQTLPLRIEIALIYPTSNLR